MGGGRGAVPAYKKKANPYKKEKILAMRHLLENERTVTGASEILFKAYDTIKNRRQVFKKGGIRVLEIKGTGRPAKIKDRALGVYGNKNKEWAAYRS